MLKNNEYYDGKVKSIGFKNAEGVATVGVIEAGEFEFTTSTDEYMTMISGSMDVMLPGSKEWRTFTYGKEFFVGKDKSFKMKSEAPAAYICVYK